MNHNFTPAEKSVLYGLVKYPRMNDRELSEVIGVKPSTTTAIRRRLRKKEIFHTRRIPMGHRFGYEILAIAYGNIKPTLSEKERQAFLDWVKGIPYVFLSMESTDSVFNMAYLKNFSMYRQYTDTITDMFKHSDLVDAKTWVAVIFGFDASKLLSYFDYGPALRYAFDIEDEKPVEPSIEKHGQEKLTKKEKNVLKGLVQYPESSDKFVAEKIGASRQAVSTMKKRFEDIGLMKTVRVVDLEKIGYSILALAHSMFTPHASLKARKAGIEFAQERIPAFLMVASNPENVMLAPVTDYDDYHNMRTEILRLYMGKDFMREEPRVMLFPLSDTRTIKNLDFSGFMDIIAEEDK
jgi:DNA-binding MarR family transcriptional regulator